MWATAGGRAKAFADRHFANCATHHAQAVAVHRALERLGARNQRGVDPEASISDLLGDPESVRLSTLDLEDMAELAMAMEAEGALRRQTIGEEAAREARRAAMTRILLGEAAQQTSWHPATVWMRSVRGLIDERVRWSGDCTCV